jgi:Xaa-Pro aminopeptidase
VYPHQAERLSVVLEGADLAALVATAPENVAYLTGVPGPIRSRPGMPRLAVFTRQGTALIVPAIELPAVVADAVDVDHLAGFGEFRAAARGADAGAGRRLRDLLAGCAATPAAALASAIAALETPAGRVGLDETGVGVEAWHGFASALGARSLVPARDRWLAARRVKGPYELECLDRALRCAEAAANGVLQMLRPGVSERDGAAVGEAELRRRGALPGPLLLAFGERTALPVSEPSERSLRRDDVVRLEVECAVEGYRGTLARTAVMADAAAAVDAAFEGLPGGIEGAIEAVRAGAMAGAVHAAAEAASRAAGLQDPAATFRGHGIGLESCEQPALDAASESALEAGDVLALEMSFYDLGRLGLSVRDTVVVTPEGRHLLNRSHRGLTLLD